MNNNSATTTPQAAPVVFQGSTKLQVSNTTLFMSSTEHQDAVTKSIADQGGVSKDHVNATFSVTTSRRLYEEAPVASENDDSRRLSAGKIKVDFTITLPSTMATATQTQKVAAISAMTAANLTSAIVSEFASRSIHGLNLTVETFSVVQVTTTMQTTTGNPIEDSGSVLGSMAWTTLLLLAMIYKAF